MGVGFVRGARPERLAADALYRDWRRVADRRLGNGDGARLMRRQSSRKARLVPGQMIAVDMSDGKLLPRHRDEGCAGRCRAVSVSGSARSSSWTRNSLRADREAPIFHRRWICAAVRLPPAIRLRIWSRSLRPMAEDGKETLASMGDDTPSPPFYRKKNRPLSAISSVRTSAQVTNPPIDSLARISGDEPEDALRQPEERAGSRQQPNRDSSS